MKVAGTVGSLPVVVLKVFREYHTQVPLADDQHAVGEFGSEGAHEPFSETVGPRRRLHPIPVIGIVVFG